MEPTIIALAVLFTLSGCGALGGIIATIKKRRPHEGLFLGLLLGPFGVAIEIWLPNWSRPIVDEGSRSSFQSMVTYQASPYRTKKSRRSNS